jgi:hypothetical protein
MDVKQPHFQKLVILTSVKQARALVRGSIRACFWREWENKRASRTEGLVFPF